MALENPRPRENMTFIQLKHLNKGDTLKGFLVGDWTQGKFKKRDLMVQASEDFTIPIAPEKDAAPVDTVIAAGTKFIVPCSGTMSKFWDEKDVSGGDLARLGTLYHFVYGGQDTIKKGEWKGSKSHIIEVLRDVEQTIEVAQQSETPTEEIPF